MDSIQKESLNGKSRGHCLQAEHRGDGGAVGRAGIFGPSWMGGEGVCERSRNFYEESESASSFIVLSVLYLCQCLIRSQSRKYLLIKI